MITELPPARASSSATAHCRRASNADDCTDPTLAMADTHASADATSSTRLSTSASASAMASVSPDATAMTNLALLSANAFRVSRRRRFDAPAAISRNAACTASSAFAASDALNRVVTDRRSFTSTCWYDWEVVEEARKGGSERARKILRCDSF